MKLREKQSIFVKLVVLLLIKADEMGYDVTFGETYRSPQEAERLAKRGLGIRNSLHTSRLAIDLNLFKDGRFLTKSEDYTKLGEYWESLSADDVTCCWGGRFSDGNHFSLAHGGRK